MPVTVSILNLVNFAKLIFSHDIALLNILQKFFANECLGFSGGKRF